MTRHVGGCPDCIKGTHIEHFRLRAAQRSETVVAEVIHVRGRGSGRRNEYLWLGNAQGLCIALVCGPKQIDALRDAQQPPPGRKRDRARRGDQ